MPGAGIGADKLPGHALTGEKKVRRHLQSPNGLEVRVRIPVELVAKKLLYAASAILTGWQADGVDHDQVDACPCRTLAKVG